LSGTGSGEGRRPGGSEGSGGRERLEGDPPSPWEGPFGFSRVVKAERFVLVGGTTSVDVNGVVLGVTPYEQAVEILRRIEHELGRAGARMADVIQTRAYVTDISRSDEIGRAHGEAFGDVRPVMTMVEVSALIDPRMQVEIEAVALV
jgi:enamine deaminase RidA (YjgF/YER057c/UK114 family)